MDLPGDDSAGGFRARWKHKRARKDEDVDADSCELVGADLSAGSSLCVDAVLGQIVKQEASLGDLEYSASEGPLPVFEPDEPAEATFDCHHPLAAEQDNEKAVANGSSSHMKLTGIKMPWESDFARLIFGDSLPSTSLSAPMGWSSQCRPEDLLSEGPTVQAQPQLLDCAIRPCVRNVSDRSYVEQHDAATSRAVNKILVLVRLSPESSQLGSQLLLETEDPDETIRAIIGVKSPHTVIKRVNSV